MDEGTGDPQEAPAAPGAAADPDEPAWERPVDRFRKTAAGSIVAAGLLGLRDVMEGRPEKEEAAIVSEASPRPVGDLHVVIDPDHPERSVAIVRPGRPGNGDEGTAPAP